MIVEAVTGHFRGMIVMDQQVGIGEQSIKDVLAARVGQIQCDAVLIGIEIQKEPALFRMRNMTGVGTALPCLPETAFRRSQFRGEGRRFMRSMRRPINVPVLPLRGDADPYVLADPVYRTQRYAPRGSFGGTANWDVSVSS